MARYTTKLTALALLASVGIAHAGGFSRGAADTDILFEEGNFNLRTGVAFVSPTRKFTKGFAPLGGTVVGTDSYESYAVPSAAVKLNITDDMRCTTTMTDVYGGSTAYAVPYGTSAKLSEKFTSTEFGLTCGYKFDLSKGRAWILGGLYYEDFSYDLVAVAGAINTKLDATDTGFRVGAAYEIPEIALRAQLMYRSGTEYDATGTTTRRGPTGTGLDGLPLGVAVPVASGNGELPQSVEMKLQSGVAPGWLVTGSVKWTDWSVLETLDLTIAPGVDRQNLYYWRDGWTVSVGVGHAFNEQLSGAVSLTWDRGVGTGFDLSSDTWTLGSGISFKDEFGGEVRFGGAITYLTSAEETQYSPAFLNAAVDSGWAFAVGGSYKAKW